MATIFNMARDVNGYAAYIPDFPQDIVSALLLQNTADSFTVPTSFPYWLLLFYPQPGLSMFVSTTGTATIPSGSFSTGDSVQNPPGFRVPGGTVVSCITPETSYLLTVSMYVHTT